MNPTPHRRDADYSNNGSAHLRMPSPSFPLGVSRCALQEGEVDAEVSKLFLDAAAQLKWLHLEERQQLLALCAARTPHQCPALCTRGWPPRARSEAATMTQPLVGFTIHDYVSSELRRVSTMEALGRALLMSEQEHLRVEHVEYPAFRRTAQFTVAKLEKLFWKQERELRGLKKRHDMSQSPVTSLLSVSPTSPAAAGDAQVQRDDVVLEQLRALLDEAEHVVFPSLIESTRTTGGNAAIDAAAHESLLAVMNLLVKEMRATQRALSSPPPIAAADKRPPIPLGGASPRTSHPPMQPRLEMGGLVSSLIEQNEALLEALQDAEAHGYAVPRSVLERLRRSSTSA